jgi:predicted nucleic acid-binding protein
VLVYCDTNIYCRPIDDQSQSRIKAETEAFLGILEQVERNEITLVGSDILTAEVSRISSAPKRKLVELYLAHCTRYIPASLQIVQIADELVKQAQLKPKDAFHIASACDGQVRYFLTCDDQVKGKRESVARLTKQRGFEVMVLNPLEFLPLVGGGGQNEKGA